MKIKTKRIICIILAALLTFGNNTNSLFADELDINKAYIKEAEQTDAEKITEVNETASEKNIEVFGLNVSGKAYYSDFEDMTSHFTDDFPNSEAGDYAIRLLGNGKIVLNEDLDLPECITGAYFEGEVVFANGNRSEKVATLDLNGHSIYLNERAVINDSLILMSSQTEKGKIYSTGSIRFNKYRNNNDTYARLYDSENREVMSCEDYVWIENISVEAKGISFGAEAKPEGVVALYKLINSDITATDYVYAAEDCYVYADGSIEVPDYCKNVIHQEDYSEPQEDNNRNIEVLGLNVSGKAYYSDFEDMASHFTDDFPNAEDGDYAIRLLGNGKIVLNEDLVLPECITGAYFEGEVKFANGNRSEKVATLDLNGHSIYLNEGAVINDSLILVSSQTEKGKICSTGSIRFNKYRNNNDTYARLYDSGNREVMSCEDYVWIENISVEAKGISFGAEAKPAGVISLYKLINSDITATDYVYAEEDCYVYVDGSIEVPDYCKNVIHQEDYSEPQEDANRNIEVLGLNVSGKAYYSDFEDMTSHFTDDFPNAEAGDYAIRLLGNGKIVLNEDLVLPECITGAYFEGEVVFSNGNRSEKVATLDLNGHSIYLHERSVINDSLILVSSQTEKGKIYSTGSIRFNKYRNNNDTYARLYDSENREVMSCEDYVWIENISVEAKGISFGAEAKPEGVVALYKLINSDITATDYVYAAEDCYVYVDGSIEVPDHCKDVIHTQDYDLLELAKVTGVTAVSNSYNSVFISWDEVKCATEYKIYRQDSTTTEYVHCGTVDAPCTSFLDTDLSFDTTYKYKIRAVKRTNQHTIYSEKSDSVKVKTVLSKVTGMMGTIMSDSSVKLDWDPVDGAEGYYLYKIEPGSDSLVYVKTLRTNSASSATVKSLVAGNEYGFVVKAYRMSGETRRNGVSSDRFNMLLLPTPTIAYAKSVNYQSVEIKWNQVAVGTGYELLVSTTRTGDYETAAKITGIENTSYVISGLKTGLTYYFKVRVLNGNTEGALSGSIYCKAGLEKPQLTVENDVLSAILSWNQIEGATGYIVAKYNLETGEYSTIKGISGGETTTCTVNGLSLGEKYSYSVRAVRKDGDGSIFYSEYSKVKTVTMRMKAPDNIRKWDTSENSVLLLWSNCKAATGYYVKVKYPGQNDYTVVKCLNGADAIAYELTDVSIGESYSVIISSYCDINGKRYYSDNSEPVEIIISP